VGKRLTNAMIKLKKQPKAFVFDDPAIPMKSRKHNFVKPTSEMRALAAAAVEAGRVRYIPPKTKGRPKAIVFEDLGSEFVVTR
jgi:hypothetical protein